MHKAVLSAIRREKRYKVRFKIVFVALIALAGCLRVEPQAEVMQEQRN